MGSFQRFGPCCSVFFIGWVFATTFLDQSFESNLRAYLIATEYNQPIDSAQDLLDSNWKLYLPDGTPFVKMFATSPQSTYQQLYEQIKDKPEQLFFYERGMIPLEIENKILKHGK